MRVIAGYLGGRNIVSPHTHHTHPMSDKLRGALFNALGELDGLTLLDSYAGSGACSIEAISRGAAAVLAIDIDTEAIKTVVRNVKMMGLSSVITVRRANISGWSRNHATERFDIVLADPPYDDVKKDVLARLTTHVLPDGLFVLSWPGSEPVCEFVGMEVVSQKKYGDAQLAFYRRPV